MCEYYNVIILSMGSRLYGIVLSFDLVLTLLTGCVLQQKCINREILLVIKHLDEGAIV